MSRCLASLNPRSYPPNSHSISLDWMYPKPDKVDIPFEPLDPLPLLPSPGPESPRPAGVFFILWQLLPFSGSRSRHLLMGTFFGGGDRFGNGGNGGNGRNGGFNGGAGRNRVNGGNGANGVNGGGNRGGSSTAVDETTSSESVASTDLVTASVDGTSTTGSGSVTLPDSSTVLVGGTTSARSVTSTGSPSTESATNVATSPAGMLGSTATAQSTAASGLVQWNSNPTLVPGILISITFIIVILGLILFYWLKRRRQLRYAREEPALHYENTTISPFILASQGDTTNPEKAPFDLHFPSEASETASISAYILRGQSLNYGQSGPRETTPSTVLTTPPPVRGSASRGIWRLASRSSTATGKRASTDVASRLDAAKEHIEVLGVRIQQVDAQMLPHVSDEHPPVYTV
ncbi:hypothetical protein B0H19DRAFT_1070219 [Mycena capillaripes]|nr:hypothetical protein B0H19DRAFT_1070219 [Mycena capillaripes]